MDRVLIKNCIKIIERMMGRDDSFPRAPYDSNKDHVVMVHELELAAYHLAEELCISSPIEYSFRSMGQKVGFKEDFQKSLRKLVGTAKQYL